MSIYTKKVFIITVLFISSRISLVFARDMFDICILIKLFILNFVLASFWVGLLVITPLGFVVKPVNLAGLDDDKVDFVEDFDPVAVVLEVLEKLVWYWVVSDDNELLLEASENVVWNFVLNLVEEDMVTKELWDNDPTVVDSKVWVAKLAEVSEKVWINVVWDVDVVIKDIWDDPTVVGSKVWVAKLGDVVMGDVTVMVESETWVVESVDWLVS